MSHISLREQDKIDQQIQSIPALQAAAERLGGVFTRKDRFTSYVTDHGRMVGDYPLPEGYTAADVSRCEFAIGISEESKKKITGHTKHYEIGVVPSKKYPGTYSLMYDFWGGALDELFTTPEGRVKPKEAGRLDKLFMYYRAEAAKQKAILQGHTFEENVMKDGKIDLKINTTGTSQIAIAGMSR